MNDLSFGEGLLIGGTGAGVVVWILVASAMVAARRDRRRGRR